MTKFSFLLSLLLCALGTLRAQPTYTFSTRQEAYQPLTGATQITPLRAWSEVEEIVTAPFDLTLFGKDIDMLYFNNDGFEAETKDQISIVYAYAFYHDVYYLIDRNYDSTATVQGVAGSKISHLTTGVPGSRIFKIEWSDLKFEGSNDGDHINFQMWFFENSDKIEFHYGPSTVQTPGIFPGAPGIQVYMGMATSDAREVGLRGDAAQPTLAHYNPDDGYPFLTGIPATGMVYVFNPSSVGINKNSTGVIKLFPNPASDIITLETPGEMSRVEITDATGRVVMSTVATGKTQQINIAGLPAGIYVASVTSGGQQATIRFNKL